MNDGKSSANPSRMRVALQPFVSILIPCFNAERWVAQAIESSLAQTCPHKEIIVVDDGSTDGSLEVVRRYDGRIRWETGPNRGANAARNRLLDLSAGEWLQYLDADDWLQPDKVASQMEFLAGNPESDVVYGPVSVVHCFENSVRHELTPIPEPHDPWVLLARWYLPQTGASLWRKQAIIDVGGWKEEQPCCQEHELYLRLLIAGKTFSYYNSTGAVYRQWSETTLCKRDPTEVRRQRLQIEAMAERILRSRNELTRSRLTAINQARFEIARSAWQSDREEATRIFDMIRRSQSDFRPTGAAAPRYYRQLLGLLGFRLTETMADWRRRLMTICRG